MRVEGYDLHAYCDNVPDEKCRAPLRGSTNEFNRGSKRETYRAAKAAGWKFGRRDLCPWCADPKKHNGK